MFDGTYSSCASSLQTIVHKCTYCLKAMAGIRGGEVRDIFLLGKSNRDVVTFFKLNVSTHLQPYEPFFLFLFWNRFSFPFHKWLDFMLQIITSFWSFTLRHLTYYFSRAAGESPWSLPNINGGFVLIHAIILMCEISSCLVSSVAELLGILWLPSCAQDSSNSCW